MNDVRSIPIKLILIGASGVGKTSLIHAFCAQTFSPESVSTVAPAFSEMTVEIDSGSVVALQIWDTAGQEQYQSISQMFYRDAQVAFICFDQKGIDGVEDWAFAVRDIVPDCRLALVGTKSDLLDSAALQALTAESARRAGELGAQFFVTSAKTGQGVPEVFQSAAKAGAEVALGRKTKIQAQSLRKTTEPEGERCC
jgi:small GTP-binding protein